VVIGEVARGNRQARIIFDSRVDQAFFLAALKLGKRKSLPGLSLLTADAGKTGDTA
jgi:hypothetical protein